MTDPDYYRTVGVPPTATAEQVKRAFRAACRRCHPDCGGSERAMIALLEAYEVLGDPTLRASYDQWRSSNGASTPAPTPPPKPAAADWRQYGASWKDFTVWLDAQTVAVEASNGGRRWAAGLSGLIAGAAAGGGFGWLFGAGWAGGVVIGGLAGALSAAFSGVRKPGPTA